MSLTARISTHSIQALINGQETTITLNNKQSGFVNTSTLLFCIELYDNICYIVVIKIRWSELYDNHSKGRY